MKLGAWMLAVCVGCASRSSPRAVPVAPVRPATMPADLEFSQRWRPTDPVQFTALQMRVLRWMAGDMGCPVTDEAQALVTAQIARTIDRLQQQGQWDEYFRRELAIECSGLSVLTLTAACREHGVATDIDFRLELLNRHLLYP